MRLREDGTVEEEEGIDYYNTYDEYNNLVKVQIENDELLKWNMLKELWSKYFKLTIKKNDKFIIPMLLSIISAHTPIQYYKRGFRRYTRFHVFIIQNPGTGKSQSMKLVHHFLDKLEILRKQYLERKEKGEIEMNVEQIRDPIVHQHITEVTDSALVGHIEIVKERGGITAKVPRYGLLSNNLLISWDEGSQIFEKNSFNEKLMSIILSAVDEPGKVSKNLRDGLISYEPKSTIIAGSYVTPKIRNVIWESGFAQRFYCVFSDIKNEDFENMINEMAVTSSEQEKQLEDERSEIEKKIANLIFQPTNIYIYLNDDEFAQVYNTDIKPFLNQQIFTSFSDRTKQNIFNSFIGRWLDIIDKTACNIAYVEGTAFLRKKHYKEAFEICKQSLLDVREFMVDKPEEMREETRKTRIRILLEMMSKFPSGLTSNELLEEIQILRSRSRWNLGDTYTKSFVQDCWRKGIIVKIDTKCQNKKGKKYIWKVKGENV